MVLMPSCAVKFFRKSALTLRDAALGALSFDGLGWVVFEQCQAGLLSLRQQNISENIADQK